jgi:hypothetical protein
LINEDGIIKSRLKLENIYRNNKYLNVWFLDLQNIGDVQLIKFFVIDDENE